MQTSTAQNPHVPFVVNLEGGLTQKKTFIIKGFIPQAASRFEIKFSEGTTGNIALHISAHIKQGFVVRNTLKDGTWGIEERDISFNPFREGQNFDVTIYVRSDRFQMNVGSKHVFDYSYRLLDLAMVNILEITGDVKLSFVQV